jgi:hypothetical protein
VKNRYSRSSSTSSLESLADSINSHDSVSSASSLATSIPEEKTAFQRIYDLLSFFSDQYRELLTRALPKKVSRNFGTLFKKFGRDLEKAAKARDEKRTAKFIRSHARKLAEKLVESASLFQVYETRHDLPSRDDSDDPEDSEGENVEEAPDDFRDLEAFIMTSSAWVQLRLGIQSLLGRTYVERNTPSSGDPSIDVHQNDEAMSEDLPEAPRSSNGGEGDIPLQALSLESVGKRIWDLLMTEPPIPEGIIRVRWRCVSILPTLLAEI